MYKIARCIQNNEAEVFSLSITNPNGRPMLPIDWLIHLVLILVSCHKILESDWCYFLFYFTSEQCLFNNIILFLHLRKPIVYMNSSCSLILIKCRVYFFDRVPLLLRGLTQLRNKYGN